MTRVLAVPRLSPFSHDNREVLRSSSNFTSTLRSKFTGRLVRKTLKMALHRLLSPLLRPINVEARRPLFYWLTVVWNRVDHERIKEVGPERACAEWLLRNGASVRWKGTDKFFTDYNALPNTEEHRIQCIQAVDATESSINHIGFPYFSGCKYIDEIKLSKCLYIENEALRRLDVVKDTLKHLEVLDCADITDSGLTSLKNLTNLKVLKLQGMPYVKDKSGVEKELTKALRNCEIEWK